MERTKFLIFVLAAALGGAAAIEGVHRWTMQHPPTATSQESPRTPLADVRTAIEGSGEDRIVALEARISALEHLIDRVSRGEVIKR